MIAMIVRSFTLESVFVTVGAVLLATPAHAIVIPPPEEITLSAVEYPEGAVITGSYYCSPGCGTESIQFYAPNGTPVSGTFIDVSATRPDRGFAWQPIEPLTVGIYSVRLEGSFDSFTFEVVAGASMPPVVTSTLSKRTTGVGEPITCQQIVDDGTILIGGVFASSVSEALVHIQMSGLSATQYSYAAEIDGARENVAASSVVFNLGTETREVCYEIFATPFAGGAEILLGPNCVDTGTLEGLGETEEVYGDLKFVLPRCTVPPVGFEDEWCAHHEPAFVSHSCDGFVYEACVAARYACASGDLPEFEDTLADDTNDPNMEGNDGGSKASEDGGGCSVTSAFPARSSSGWGLWSLIAGATFLVRRRRLGRAPTLRL